MLTWNDMAEINKARNEKWMKCPMCPWVLISLASLTCAGMSGYRGGWKTSVERGRCKGSGEKGAHEQTMMRSWMNAWAAWSGARRGDDARSLCDATLREVGAEEPTEVMNGMTVWRSTGMCLWRVWRPEDAARSMVRMHGGVGYRRWLWRDSESPGGKVE